MNSPFNAGLREPPSRAPQAPPAPAPAQPQPGSQVAPSEGISGRVVGPFNKTPLCTGHFPAPPELTRLAVLARGGRPQPFVGAGDAYQSLFCPCLDKGEHLHPDQRWELPWRLGDHLVHISQPCMTGAHDRCHDTACQCECQGTDAVRALTAAADTSLAEALSQIAGAFQPQAADPRLAQALEMVAALQKKVEALEAAPASERGCTAETASGKPCKGRAGDDGLCAAHKST